MTALGLLGCQTASEDGMVDVEVAELGLETAAEELAFLEQVRSRKPDCCKPDCCNVSGSCTRDVALPGTSTVSHGRSDTVCRPSSVLLR